MKPKLKTNKLGKFWTFIVIMITISVVSLAGYFITGYVLIPVWDLNQYWIWFMMLPIGLIGILSLIYLYGKK